MKFWHKLKSWLHKLIEPQTLILLATLWVAWSIGNTQNDINKKIEEESIKPIILRGGILDWSSIRNFTATSTSELSFEIYNNIAESIRGKLIYEGSEYSILFKLTLPDKNNQGKYICDPHLLSPVEWAKSNTVLCGFPDWTSGIKTSKTDQIQIEYKDSEANPYCTKENRDLSETIINGPCS